MAVKKVTGLEKDSPDSSNSTGSPSYSSASRMNGKPDKGLTNGGESGSKTSNNNGGKGRVNQGRNHRHHRQQQRRRMSVEDSSASSPRDYDLDLSIQEELVNGHYRLRGRKAQVSINHLLQFQLPEIDRQSDTGYRKIGRRKNETKRQVHLHGDSFINANYRLMVDDRFDYQEQSNNPNIPVPQENIVRVIVPKGQNCPICLGEELVAPQMVACGHVFCLNCLLNFFSAEETVKTKTSEYVQKKKYKECPLCGSIVRPNKVKPVLFEENEGNEIPQPDKEINLKLMCKPHDSLLPLPVELGIDPLSVGNFPSVELPQVRAYSHIMKCSVEHSLQLFQKDLEDISTQYEIDRTLYEDNGKFYKLATQDINERITKIIGQVEEKDFLDQSIAKLNLGFDLKSKYNDTNAYFFFQTAFQSSTRFFLSPLDVKILLTAFHHYSKFPEKIIAAVENVHYGAVVTEELIGRYKYIGHLPLGTEIAFIDLDWRESTAIPNGVYQQFVVELKQRRRKLNIKKQKEDKEKLNYEKRLEREHAEFYRRENGDTSMFQDIADIGGPFIDAGSSEALLDSLSARENDPRDVNGDITNEQISRPTHVEKTIWGTSIPVQTDEQASKENKEFEAMLLQKMQQEEDIQDPVESDSNTNGKKGKRRNRKKKTKVMLFSSTHQTL